jgi:DNA-binding LacI/PurR family transcriptional regulator
MKSITQRTLAEHLGINVSSVSRALKGDQRISPLLRKRVERAAEELKYRPDPAVSALANRRWEKDRRKVKLTLAFIADHAIAVRPGYDELKRAAESMGYGIDPIEIKQGTSHRPILRILQTRNVAGVIFHVDSTLSVALREISANYPAVNWNCRVDHPSCPGVMRDAYHRVSDCCEKLVAREVERALLVIPGTSRELNELTRQMMAAWRFFQAGRSGWMDPVFYHDDDWEVVAAAVREARPEVLVVGSVEVVQGLNSLGVGLGKELPFVCMDVPPDASCSGIQSTFPWVSRYAVDLIDRMIARRLTGKEIAWIQIEVRGEWSDGDSF